MAIGRDIIACRDASQAWSESGALANAAGMLGHPRIVAGSTRGCRPTTLTTVVAPAKTMPQRANRAIRLLPASDQGLDRRWPARSARRNPLMYSPESGVIVAVRIIAASART